MAAEDKQIVQPMPMTPHVIREMASAMPGTPEDPYPSMTDHSASDEPLLPPPVPMPLLPRPGSCDEAEDYYRTPQGQLEIRLVMAFRSGAKYLGQALRNAEVEPSASATPDILNNPNAHLDASSSPPLASPCAGGEPATPCDEVPSSPPVTPLGDPPPSFAPYTPLGDQPPSPHHGVAPSTEAGVPTSTSPGREPSMTQNLALSTSSVMAPALPRDASPSMPHGVPHHGTDPTMQGVEPASMLGVVANPMMPGTGPGQAPPTYFHFGTAQRPMVPGNESLDLDPPFTQPHGYISSGVQTLPMPMPQESDAVSEFSANSEQTQ
jgi:hypothetical protein